MKLKISTRNCKLYNNVGFVIPVEIFLWAFNKLFFVEQKYFYGFSFARKYYSNFVTVKNHPFRIMETQICHAIKLELYYGLGMFERRQKKKNLFRTAQKVEHSVEIIICEMKILFRGIKLFQLLLIEQK